VPSITPGLVDSFRGELGALRHVVAVGGESARERLDDANLDRILSERAAGASIADFREVTPNPGVPTMSHYHSILSTTIIQIVRRINSKQRWARGPAPIVAGVRPPHLRGEPSRCRLLSWLGAAREQVVA
jgi:hypothetical protein